VLKDLEDVPPAPEIDVTRPHPARMYDYGLGGKNHFAADRAVADQVLAIVPTIRTVARENRGFLGRATRYLAAEVGIGQFLDIGSGLPATGNVHEVAQDVAPQSRVVYVDNDPLVLVHARALLASSPEGRTGYIQADLRDPASILDSPETARTLDFSQPVALVLCAILHFLADADDPAAIVATLVGALRRAVTWSRPTPRPSTRHPTMLRQPCASTGHQALRSSRAIPATSAGSRSPASTWCRPGWSWSRNGTLMATDRTRRRPRSAATAAWRESPS
jgi:hypothetical protein